MSRSLADCLGKLRTSKARPKISDKDLELIAKGLRTVERRNYRELTRNFKVPSAEARVSAGVQAVNGHHESIRKSLEAAKSRRAEYESAAKAHSEKQPTKPTDALKDAEAAQPHGVRPEPQVPTETPKPSPGVGGEGVPEGRQGEVVEPPSEVAERLPFKEHIRKETSNKWSDEAYEAALKYNQTGEIDDRLFAPGSVRKRALLRIHQEFVEAEMTPEQRAAADAADREAEAKLAEERKSDRRRVKETTDPAADRPKGTGFSDDQGNPISPDEARLYSGIPIFDPGLIAKTARDAYRIAETFAGWSGEMIARMGRAVIPHLQKIWNAFKSYVKGALDAAKKTSETGAVGVEPIEKPALSTEPPASTAKNPFTYRLHSMLGKSPSGKLLFDQRSVAEDGTVSKDVFVSRTSNIPKYEKALYESLVPEAFTGDKVNVKMLDEKLRDLPAVEVHTYGQGGEQTPEKTKFDELNHTWWDSLTFDQKTQFERAESPLNDGAPIDSEKLRSYGWSNEQILKAQEFDRLKTIVTEQRFGAPGSPRATTAYNQVSPLDTTKHPVKRIDVVLPKEKPLSNEELIRFNDLDSRSELSPEESIEYDKLSKRHSDIVLWPPDNTHEQLPNTLGWAMVQETTHNGERVWLIGEMQSRWGQDMVKRKASERDRRSSGRGGDPLDPYDRTADEQKRMIDQLDHPLLSSWESLVLKSVLDQARRAGVKKVVLSDGETAMMTEGHDKHTPPSVLGGKQSFATEKEAYDHLESEKKDGRKILSSKVENTGTKYLPWQLTYEMEPRIQQASGMRAQYDKRGPDILRKLTGEEGKAVDLGVHKNARSETQRESPLFATEAEARAHAGPGGTVRGEGSEWSGYPPDDVSIGSPVFRTPEGKPKTQITGREYTVPAEGRESMRYAPVSTSERDFKEAHKKLRKSGIHAIFTADSYNLPDWDLWKKVGKDWEQIDAKDLTTEQRNLLQNLHEVAHDVPVENFMSDDLKNLFLRENKDEFSGAASVGEVLDSISKDSPYGLIAEVLNDIIGSDVKKVTVRIDEKVKTAHYDTEKNEIVTRSSYLDDSVIIHEIVHASTERKMASVQRFVEQFKGVEYREALEAILADKSGSPIVTKEIKELISAYLEAVDKIGMSDRLFDPKKGIANKPGTVSNRGLYYGLSNLSEFLSESITDRSFQRKLNSIKSDKAVSVWRRLVNAIANLLGMDVGSGTLLERALSAGHKLMNAPDDPGFKKAVREREGGRKLMAKQSEAKELKQSEIPSVARKAIDALKSLDRHIAYEGVAPFYEHRMEVDNARYEVAKNIDRLQKTEFKDEGFRKAAGAYIEAKTLAARSNQTVERVLALEATDPDIKKNPEYKAAWDRAQRLTPEEKASIDKLQAIYEERRKYAEEQGLLADGQRIENYIARRLKPPVDPDKKVAYKSYLARLSKEFMNSREREFPSMFDAIKAGFHPESLDVLKNLSDYDVHLRQTAADLKLQRNLTTYRDENGNPIAGLANVQEVLVEPVGARAIDAPVATEAIEAANMGDFRRYDAPFFRRVTFERQATDRDGNLLTNEDGSPKMGKYTADMVLSPKAYRMVNSLIGKSPLKEWYQAPSFSTKELVFKKAVEGADKFNSWAKKWLFSGGLFHSVTLGGRAIGGMINPFRKFIDIDLENNPNQRDAARHGLGFIPSVDRAWSEGEGLGGVKFEISNIPVIKQWQKWSNLTREFTFEKVLPTYKTATWEKWLPMNMKTYGYKPGAVVDGITEWVPIREGAKLEMSPESVKHLTAHQINTLYGHDIRWDAPIMKHIFSLGIAAPDFLRAGIDFTVGAGKGLMGAKSGRLQAVSMTVMAGAFYGAARVINSILNDGDSKPEYPFSIVYNGREYSMRTKPGDVLKLYDEGISKFSAGRLAPLAKLSEQIVSGRNYRGEKVPPFEMIKEFGLSGVPIPIREVNGINQLIDTSRTGAISPLESVLAFMGIHTRRNSPITETYRLAEKWKKDNDRPDTGSYPQSKYAAFKRALEDGNLELAETEFKRLMEEEKDTANAKKFGVKKALAMNIKQGLDHSFVDSRTDEEKFVRSLTHAQREQYRDAIRARNIIWKRAQRFLGPGHGELIMKP